MPSNRAAVLLGLCASFFKIAAWQIAQYDSR